MPGGRPVDPIWADFDKFIANGKLSHITCKLCHAKVSAKVKRMKGHMDSHQTGVNTSTSACGATTTATEPAKDLPPVHASEDEDIVEVTQPQPKKVCLISELYISFINDNICSNLTAYESFAHIIDGAKLRGYQLSGVTSSRSLLLSNCHTQIN